MEIDESGIASVPAVQLDAAQLEQHIRDLAVLRRRMAPEVPRDYAGGPTLDIADADVMAGTLGSGNVALLVRHTGLGWLQMEFSPPQAALVAEMLRKAAGHAAGARSLDLQDDPGVSRTH